MLFKEYLYIFAKLSGRRRRGNDGKPVGNMVGAFVGTECRGTVTLSEYDGASFIICGRAAGESVTIKYYDAATSVLYTIPDAVKL